MCANNSLLETFAAVTHRRTPAATSSGNSTATTAYLSSSSGQDVDAPTTNTYNSRNTALSLSASVFGSRLSTKSVSSLVKLAMSANFPNSLINQVGHFSCAATLKQWNVFLTEKHSI